MTGSEGEDAESRLPALGERVRLFALRRLGDVEAAEDVAQETLGRVLEALRSGRVHDPEALPGFVFQTARHVCQHRWRSREREERALERLASSDPEPRRAPEPLISLVSRERARAVRDALERLSPDDRALLRALYFEDREPSEVARCLGVTPGALRVRKHRALKRLEAVLDPATGNGPSPSGTE
ncbi:MAG TPA: sigma-70 family RNA polymerase sigma factor [Longimicrobiales bacterium]|nr:sigma-70 family RNA polymerase sigma factor [Longimicrobiales bacterium]